ncbi:related to cytosolic nonspecific dipeptidase [Cephalotrichum gorgonifer]|uniref:Related to cytosolic nonspecific dipeptidase n=1 Tax=Cephalotrichum gorgonifer TaxID=2041049 RepID=A0AAE8SYA3_9PEZI|nr:related to cytosolic nonspecific dipeptidase [Cephalotrichum gorgonifer]
MALPNALPLDPLDMPYPQPAPELVHTLHHDSSVLSLAVRPDLDYIFAGTEGGEIVVWSLATFRQVHRVQAHKRGVLSLSLSPDGSLLFSSAGDPVVNAWCPRSMTRLYEIYSTYDVGDLFSVAYSPQHDTLYMGAQNTSIQWVRLSDPGARVPVDSARHPDRRNHRFFDSKAVGGASTPRRNDERWALIPPPETVLEIDSGATYNFAHFGYVYCMLMAKGPTVLVDPDEDVLISGGGDGTIKLWRLGVEAASSDGDSHGSEAEHGIEEIMCLGSDDAESVLSLAIDKSFLYAGKIEGIIELWDLDTKQRLRSIKAHRGDVMSLQMSWGCLWSAAATGSAAKHNTSHYGKYQTARSGEVSQKYQCLSRWRAHKAKILATAVTAYKHNSFFITGANDDEVAIWRANEPCDENSPNGKDTDDNAFTSTLREFVSYKTVSSRPEFAEDCRKGATFLGGLFKRMGGHVEMLSTEKPHNPVVLATFSGKLQPPQRRKRILFYGHYDVVAADNKKGTWANGDPFRMEGINGYLYGRGVSDNKGPILAALFAVTDLMEAKALENDVVFLIEGEEEFGSRGFQETVRQNKALIGDVDYVLLANSYWLDDEVPCLTYGLRGVLHATVCVDSSLPDRHSGVDGSCLKNEPLSDLTSVLSSLKGRGNHVLIPGFYDNILPAEPEEESRFDEAASILMRRRGGQGAAAGSLEGQKALLRARWREPNLTIHRYKVSGPDGSLVSSHASASISLRLVPGQELDEVVEALQAHLRERFAGLGSDNVFSVKIDNKAEPWLGRPGNYIFRTLEDAVVKVWSELFEGEGDGKGGGGASKGAGKRPRRPLYIREGGSIPAIRFLEKQFGAPAAHLPCGQASDAAHLDNERLRILNLVKSREIFKLVFGRL